MKSNKMLKHNTEAINHFFGIKREDTAKEMSKFLFELQGLYFKQSEIEMSSELKDDSVMKFELLYTLVNELRPAKKTFKLKAI